ncbi:MAG: hypothetical protein ABSC02_16210 [Acidobacteriota bacterium]
MKKALILLLFLLPASLMWLSCGGSSAGTSSTSGIKYRAFLSNNVSAGTSAAGVYIVNAQDDVRGPASPISAGNTPGMMVVTPNHAETLVFSGNGTQTSDNQLTIINNAGESAAGHVTLPGMTESFVVSPDSSTAYIAVPTAPVVGESPGVVEVVSLSSASFTGQVAIPSIHYLSINNSGSQILGFSDNSDSVAVITPTLIGIGNAVTYVGGPGVFDRPVAAFFSSDNSTAYVVSCGAECGGTQASVQQYDLINNTLVASVPSCVPNPGSNPVTCSSLAAGSVALVNGSTMYLAGSPPYAGGEPQQPCTGEKTGSPSCGLLTILNLSTMSVTNTTPIIIADGYHDRIELGANGQLFIGSHHCTEIIPPVPPPPGAEVRGCLSIYNSLPSAVGSVPAGGVVIPPANGDVTGLQPISTRVVVYVVQGGSLNIYDDTIDALEYNPNNPNNPGEIYGLVGQFFDVKTVDF